MAFEFGLITPPLKEVLGRYVKSARLILLLVVCITMVSSLANVGAPYLFSRLVDRVQPDDIASGLMWAFTGYAGLMGFWFALQRVSGILTFMTSESLKFVTSTVFFERLVEKTSTFFLDHNPTEIQNAQSKGKNALNIVVQFGLVGVLPGLMQLLLSLGLLSSVISLEIALIVFIYGVIYIVLVTRSAYETRPHLDKAIEEGQASARFVGNALASMDTLRQFQSSKWMVGQFADREKAVLNYYSRYALIHVRFAVLFGMAMAAQFALNFCILVPRVANGALSLGDLVLFNTLVLQLTMPFQMMGQAIQQFAESYSNFLPFARMWQTEAHDDFTVAGGFALSEGAVVFENVGYRYTNGRGVSGASFKAQRGQLTYLVGDTGAGKSTLFKLLLKTMAPQSGRILIDGHDLADVTRADWFNAVALVPQDIVLLNDTLATNIVLGRDFDEKRLARAAGRAAILSFIEGLDEGFETIVGERGLKLSGGERQRIAIARALYADPAIILLDEASSALDVETEKDIMDQLRQLADQATVIAITHRKSVITDEDQVVDIKSSQ